MLPGVVVFEIIQRLTVQTVAHFLMRINVKRQQKDAKKIRQKAKRFQRNLDQSFSGRYDTLPTKPLNMVFEHEMYTI